MFIHVPLFLIFAWSCHGKPRATPIPTKTVGQHLVVRQTPQQFQQSFNLSQVFEPRDTLISNNNGLTLTCIDCLLEGSFNVTGTFDIDATRVQILASSLAAEVTPVAAQISSAIVHAASSVVSDAEHLLSKVETFFKPLVPTDLPNIFHGLNLPIKRDVASDAFQEIMKGINLDVTQTAPIKSHFNLELVSGDQGVNIPFNVPLPFTRSVVPGTAIANELATPLDLGADIQASFIFKPLAIRIAAQIKPHINTTIPFGADFSLNDTFSLGLTSLDSGKPDIDLHMGNINVTSFDPTFCMSVAIGPAFGISLKHIPTGTQANVTALIQLPKLTVCFDEKQNVNKACQSQPGPLFAKALNVNGTMDLNVVLESGLTVGGKSFGVPTPGDLGFPALAKSVSLGDECLDLDQLLGMRTS